MNLQLRLQLFTIIVPLRPSYYEQEKRGFMPRKTMLLLVLSALLLTMCRFYSQSERVTPLEGLSCQGYKDYFEQGLRISSGLECYYTCPNGVIAGPLDFEADPALSFSKSDLNRMHCSADSQSTRTAPSVSPSPTLAASPTQAASPTLSSIANAEASPTAIVTTASQPSLLTGQVTMCDTGVRLISFRIVIPAPDITGKTLAVQISNQETSCAINATNPSLLTCTIPPSVVFPARVVASLDGAIVNDFIYDGLGCAELSPPLATTTP